MKMLMQAAMAAGAFCLATSVAMADPAVIYDVGGKFDKSFNEGAYNGAEKFKAETGIDYREFEIQTDAQREQALRKLRRSAAQTRSSPSASARQRRSRRSRTEFPEHAVSPSSTSVVDLPNVQSIVFKEHEGSLPGRRARRAREQDRARSGSSAAWTFRSSATSPAATCRA